MPSPKTPPQTSFLVRTANLFYDVFKEKGKHGALSFRNRETEARILRVHDFSLRLTTDRHDFTPVNPTVGLKFIKYFNVPAFSAKYDEPHLYLSAPLNAFCEPSNLEVTVSTTDHLMRGDPHIVIEGAYDSDNFKDARAIISIAYDMTALFEETLMHRYKKAIAPPRQDPHSTL